MHTSTRTHQVPPQASGVHSIPTTIKRLRQTGRTNKPTTNQALSGYLSIDIPADLLSSEREAQLLIAAQTGDKNARNTLILHNMRLVFAIVGDFPRDYHGREVDTQDLVQVGIERGLMHAIDKYKPNKGARFATYAIQWIYQEVKVALYEQVHLLSIPAYIIENQEKIEKARYRALQSDGVYPDHHALAELIGVSWATYVLCLQYDQEYSLEAPLRSGEETALRDYLATTLATDPSAEIRKRERTELLFSLIAHADLDQRECHILHLRYIRGLTLREAAKMLLLSRTSIANIEKAALGKLRRATQYI